MRPTSRPAALFASAAVVMCISFWGCSSPNAPVIGHSEGTQRDSITVVLSKYYSSQNYRKWLGRLHHSQGLPPLRFFQAYGASAGVLNQELSRASAVVLTGGEDIHPARYNQAADTVRCGRIDPERDRVEHVLLDHVLSTGVPCLGVCRGLQIMNVHGGGSLLPHLPDEGHLMHRGGQLGQTSDTLHPVEVMAPWVSGPTSFSKGDQASVVSHHHQGIGRLAASFEAWAKSPDGLIEGIRHSDTLSLPFLVGVQWHPERSDSGLTLTDGLGLALLAAIEDRTAEGKGPH